MSINLRAGNSQATATPLTIDATNRQITGSEVSVTASASDYYTFYLPGRSSLNFSLSSLTTGNDVNIDLLASDGTTLIRQANNSNSLPDPINVFDQGAGTYYVKVYTTSTTNVSYSLNFAGQSGTRHADLLWRNYGTPGESGNTALWTMNGVSPIARVNFPTVADSNWRLVGTGDFNQDNEADLVWRNYGAPGSSLDAGRVAIWTMNGSTPLRTVFMPFVIADVNWRIEGVTDFNRDGSSDLVWRNYGAPGSNADAGRVAIWTMNGINPVQTVFTNFVVSDVNWRLEGTADFNQDNQSDLVWRHYGVPGSSPDAGKVAIWTMNGTAPVQTVFMPFTVADRNWQIEGLADFNQDNRTDLVWRHYGTPGSSPDAGRVAIWTMNGTTPIQTIAMPFLVSDPNWRLEGVRIQYDAPARIDIDGNTIATAFKIGTLPGSGVFRDYVSSQDAIDRYQFSLSSSSSFSALLGGLQADADLVLYNSNGAVVASSRNRGSGTDAINLNLSPGAYYLAVESADNLPTNYSLSVSNTTATLANLVGAFFDATPEPLPAGNSLTVNFRVQNSGNRSAANFRTGFYLSTDPTITKGDRWLGFYDIAGLAAGAITTTLATTLALPNASDPFWSGNKTYYIGMVVDWFDAVGESNELNNSTVGLGVDYDDVQISIPVNRLIDIRNLTFSGREGDAGTFQIQLNQAPTADVTLTFEAGSFLTIDADGDINTGTQNSLTFTTSNWNQVRTVQFTAENDASGSDRTSGNTITYTLDGGQMGSGTLNLGTILNTYAPDPTRFNIDLDYRNDTYGFWTPARRTIVQQAANDWANLIADELATLTLNNEFIAHVGARGSFPFTFNANRAVDDLVVFVGSYMGDGNGGWGGPSLITSAADPLPRAGVISINAEGTLWSASDIYSLAAHEIGHVLGLLGLNYTSAQLISNGYFTGAYSRAFNGGNNVPLAAGGGHPADAVVSLMSYGTGYDLSAPSEMDKRFLADSGYRVYGVNVSSRSIQPPTNPQPMSRSSQPIRSAAPFRCGCSLCQLSTNLMTTIGSSDVLDRVDVS